MICPPKFTDSEPTEKDLEMLVVGEVSECNTLGIMLNVKTVCIERFKKIDRDPVAVNRKILTTWMEEETRKPTTWHTLLPALQDMDINRLVHQITKELKQRLLRST